MAFKILSNKKNTSAVIHFTPANSTLTIAGNSTVSNVAIENEILTGAYITQVFYGNDGAGSIQVLRGTSLVAVYDSTGYVDYAGSGMALTANSTSSLTVNFVGSANSYLLLEVQKEGPAFSSEYFQN
jgi:hypothetical protein